MFHYAITLHGVNVCVYFMKMPCPATYTESTLSRNAMQSTNKGN